MPLLQIFSGVLGISGTFPAVWIAHTIFGLPLCIFLLHNFISEIPGEVIEARACSTARTTTQIFFRVIIPLSLPAACLDRHLPVPLGLERSARGARVLGGYGRRGTVDATFSLELVGKLRAQYRETACRGIHLPLIIPLIVFFSLQRYFVRGLLAGSTKG